LERIPVSPGEIKVGVIMGKGRYGTGHILKRTSGSYRLSWQGPVGADGKRQRLKKTFRGTATEANAENCKS
jgi:hypothetical protein